MRPGASCPSGLRVNTRNQSLRLSIQPSSADPSGALPSHSIREKALVSQLKSFTQKTVPLCPCAHPCCRQGGSSNSTRWDQRACESRNICAGHHLFCLQHLLSFNDSDSHPCWRLADGDNASEWIHFPYVTFACTAWQCSGGARTHENQSI